MDGIPALVDPKMVPVSEMKLLSADDRVMVVAVEGETFAYPRKILDYHELVNDRVGSTPFLVSWCPLCGSGMVFDRRVKGETFEFGVSGLLYENDVLMYDRTTDSLWSQLRGDAVVGSMTGTELPRIPHTETSWKRYRSSHPDGTVMSFETGYRRNYQQTAYKRYRRTSGLMFPVSNRDSRLSPKTSIVGVTLEDWSVAVREQTIKSDSIVTYKDNGERVIFIHWRDGIRAYRAPKRVAFKLEDGRLLGDGRHWSVSTESIAAPDGKSYERLSHVDSYWFAWATFHPRTELIQ